MTNYTIKTNPAFNSVEISFDGKPAEAVRDALKALRFRWHGVKKLWYGYATEEAVKKALEAVTETAEQITEAIRPPKKAGTPQDHVRVFYNGIKIDNGQLIKCGYSLNNNKEGSDSVSIYVREYGRLPRDIFEVKNNTDIYTDYFDSDHAYLTPEHPLFIYFQYVAMKARARDAKKHIEYREKELKGREYWKGYYDFCKEEIEKSKKQIAEFEKMTDPGQPTKEDLEKIDLQRMEAENKRKEEEHLEQCRRQEKALCKRINGKHLLLEQMKQYPIKDGEPVVLINWSEHSAFYDWKDDELTLSVACAEIVLSQFDRENHSDPEKGYDKTKFTITGTDETGEPFSYEGRYDLGDGEGGLIQHIRNLGQWELTHDQYGHEKPQPDETNERIQFADYLEQFTI